jgi:predicted ribosome quality control (RQC) complex YloA/Tae2 family protein
MSLNWKELNLIVSELNFDNARLQGVIQHDFHSLSWIFYSSERGKWTLYSEIGTNHSRIHESKKKSTPPQYSKTKKLQRFVQYCRANLEGGKVIDAKTIEGDRVFIITLKSNEKIFNIFFRLYSGPGANILITDENFVILESLFRRPNRNEIQGDVLEYPEPREDNFKFNIRDRIDDKSFNEQIEEEYGKITTDFTLQQLVEKIENQKNKELKKAEGNATALKKKLQQNENFEQSKVYANLLSSNVYLIKPHTKSVTVDNWETGEKIEIPLNEKLNASGNIEYYFDKYKRAKRTYNTSKESYEDALKNYDELKTNYTKLLTLTDNEGSDIRRLKKALDLGSATKQTDKVVIGLRFESHKFNILVGRNAKENDYLLRHSVRGNDWWMHTRDFPGGYVFIKNQKDKSVPLDVIIDAANLAILYSKAKNSGVADLYYTQVKYLRRAKNGPLGLVLPTNEKNLHVALDDKRINTLFEDK